MSDRAAHWQTVYTTKAETEVSWYQADPATSLRLIRDAVAAPAARIIEIGGGTSRLVDALLAAGYRGLTVLDISEAALATTRHRLGAAADDVTWIREDVTTWMPDATYDLWHDRAVFHFLTEARDRADQIMRSMILTPGSEDWRDWVIHVSDDDGEEIFDLPFAAMLGKPH